MKISSTQITFNRMINCWLCKKEFNEYESKQVSCKCEKKIIQPVNKNVNYFELFDLPIKYHIDQNELTKSFRDMMKYLHPDKFTTKSEVI
jgi:hypothetical protein